MASDTSNLTHLGSNSTKYNYDEPNASILETFANPHIGRKFVIGLDCLEFTSLCPMTGQPDYGKVWIDYVADQLCVESKSLKLYLVAYRNHGAFHEDCINQIANDIIARIDPVAIRVYGDFNVRGGIAIKPMVFEYGKTVTDSDVARIDSLYSNFDRISGR
ncbi:MAG: preQ(1) synthase [Actinomycetota bacterium]|nr:preQ(1) synthase [Actinomycetota bacterium]